MAYVEVDVDIDQFDDDDLIHEFKYRLEKRIEGKLKKIHFKNDDDTLQEVLDLLLKIPTLNNKNAPSESIADIMKMEYIQEVFNDFSEFQFREMVEDYKQKQKGYKS